MFGPQTSSEIKHKNLTLCPIKNKTATLVEAESCLIEYIKSLIPDLETLTEEEQHKKLEEKSEIILNELIKRASGGITRAADITKVVTALKSGEKVVSKKTTKKN